MASPPILIIGAGIAGLSAALRLAPRPVTVLTGAPLGEGSATAWAQGGIAAALSEDDAPEYHAADTVAAGAGLVDEARAKQLTNNAVAQILWLEKLGVPFDKAASGAFTLGREAAHGFSRIVHAGGDGTGAAIMRALIKVAHETPSIHFHIGWRAVDFVVRDNRVMGVHLQRGDETAFMPAGAVILATGGIGQLYRYTTNPPAACGEGLAMAARAGAKLADLEFVQFHPTALAIGRDPMPLLTEALRGDGAVLINERGQRFMADEHPSAELAPRDVVARAIWKQLQKGARPMLDARTAVGTQFSKKYPVIYAVCQSAGLDPLVDALPVAPAAHYHMGGVAVDAYGRSSVDGLWACGEVASSGLHGANRLASNSLLEALVFAQIIAGDIAGKDLFQDSISVVPLHKYTRASAHDHTVRQALRDVMYHHVGLVRNAQGLTTALRSIQAYRCDESVNHVTQAMLLVTGMMAFSALQREESRGAHFRTDFPLASATALRSMLDYESFERHAA